MASPLDKFTRTERLYIPLPSQGMFYDDSVVEFTSNKEVGIMPMTALDEISMNTPDALFNSEGIKKAIESCVPAVKDSTALVSQDFDAILLGIRHVSHGDDFEFTSKCPKCEHENTFVASIKHMLETMTLMTGPYVVELNKELKVFVKPHTFKYVTHMALEAYETAKLLQQMQSNIEGDLDDKLIEKLKTDYHKSIEKLAALSVEGIIDGIDHVEVNGTRVESDADIYGWLIDVDRKTIQILTDKINNIEGGIEKKLQATCEECKHEWDQQIEYNPTNFFG